jgi:hypothetical protein
MILASSGNLGFATRLKGYVGTQWRLKLLTHVSGQYFMRGRMQWVRYDCGGLKLESAHSFSA